MLRIILKFLLSFFGIKMKEKNLIWYVGYGSNLDRSRFLCYIIGGQPDGNSKSYVGCRDRTLPTDEKSIIINHEIYFAKNSTAWNGGGVAFININESEQAQTFSRMYLIRRQQFEDIAKQETNSEALITINFEETILLGQSVFKRPSWYGRVLYLGNDKEYPIFTLTNEDNQTVFTRPDERYISTLMNGIQQSFNLSKQDLVNYFTTKRGIIGAFSVESLNQIAGTVINK
jgi:hypothetical protein